MASLVNGLRNRRCQRFGIAVLVFVLFVIILTQVGGDVHPRTIGQTTDLTTPTVARCGSGNDTRAAETWQAVQSKYRHLPDDKFTIALSTFHRPKELKLILESLLTEKIPSLLEIVVVWNNFNETPPKTFTSEHGVTVRYRMPPRDSLNEKLWPDPHYRTRAILLTDDDVFYRPHDLEYVFQMWRQFGQHRMTGALARCVTLDQNGDWEYEFCSSGDDEYALVLTNLAFTDIAFLDLYFSDDSTMTRIRQHVDDHFNCEDIALNFVASYHTRAGPLLVRGRDQYVNLNPVHGISQKPGHIAARSRCLNNFTQEMGCMPLVNQNGHLERGVKHNVWYKTVWDRYGW